jgi:hypothetical protein
VCDSKLRVIRTCAIASILGVVAGACVDRTIEPPLHERLSVEEVCELYCEVEQTCEKIGSHSNCYEVCVDPWRIWPEMSEACAHARFLRNACVADLGCDGLPEAGSGEKFCTPEEVAPDYEYTPEDCGFTVLDGEGG